MTQDYKHPIAPPPELREQWIRDHSTCHALACQAAQWGFDQANANIERKLQEAADRELEACCEWNNDYRNGLGRQLRAARRPKPPSLKERIKQAISSGDTGLAIKLLEDLNDTV